MQDKCCAVSDVKLGVAIPGDSFGVLESTELFTLWQLRRFKLSAYSDFLFIQIGVCQQFLCFRADFLDGSYFEYICRLAWISW